MEVNKVLIRILSVIDSLHDFYNSTRIKETKEKEQLLKKQKINLLLKNDDFLNFQFSEYVKCSPDIKIIINKIFELNDSKTLKDVILENDVNQLEFRNLFLKKLLKINDELQLDKKIIKKYEMLKIIDNIILENFKLIFMTKTQINLIENYTLENNTLSYKKFNILLTNIGKIRLPLFYLINNLKNINIDELNIDINKYEFELYICSKNKIEKIKYDIYNCLNTFNKLQFSQINYTRMQKILPDFNDIMKNDIILISNYIKYNKIYELNNYIDKNIITINLFLSKFIIIKNKINNSKIKFIYFDEILLFIDSFTVIILKIKELNELNKENTSKKTKIIIIYELLDYIISIYKGYDICLESHKDIIENIKFNFEIIKKNKNITYPIGVILQDNTSYNSSINDLDYKTLYPVHHNYFDASNVSNNSVPDKINNNILQLLNVNNNQNIEKLDKKNIPTTLYNINLDHNDDNQIKLSNKNIEYYLSCLDEKFLNSKCENNLSNPNDYDSKDKVSIQKKMLFFKSIENNEIHGFCIKNSVDELSNVLYLLIQYKNKNDNIDLFENKKDFYIQIGNKSIKWLKNDEIIFKINLEIEINLSEYISNNNNYFKLCDIILGCKRFGDWYVQNLALNNYFFVKTNDFWANVYGLLLGTPCVFPKDKNYYMFNYLPPYNLIELFNEGKSNISIYSYKSIDGNKNNSVYNQNSIVNLEKNKKQHELENLNLFLTNEQGKIIANEDFERYYFNKYIKYKLKYNELKKNNYI